MPVRLESRAEPIPGYKLIERVGGGGFGEVWKAEAPGGLLKAIKFVYGNIDTPDEDGVRAGQELKALARVRTVRHPFILSLERFDIVDGQLMIVMELADRNLWDRFRECRSQGLPGIPRDELLRYMVEAAEALDLMNQTYDLQHLDIKPQNLFLVHNHLKVADFGLVKDLEGLAASVTGGVTPVYAAPETFDGWVSRFSDQYSLAIVYQELLTGQRPFAGNNTRQLIMQHLQGSPNLEPAPPADRPALARALAKTPTDRFPTCLELIQALKEGIDAVPKLPVEESAPEPVLTHVGPVALADTPDSAPKTQLASAAAVVPGPSSQNLTLASDMEMLVERKRESKPFMAPPKEEERGDGLLFPALVIGLGEVGYQVLKALRQRVRLAADEPELPPTLRLLYIDTDPDSFHNALQAPNAEALSVEEILLARLNRSARYLRPRESLPPLDEWLDTKMIHRIPRNPVTMGIRALGRLAFVDNYRSIVARLRRDLERITAPDGLVAAAQATGLGLRSSWPRVYIVSSLGGGTGSGMFLDLAYVVRARLRELGYVRPDVVGLFVLPPIDDPARQALPLANTYASLIELNHFSAGGETFKARYEPRGSGLKDAEPPFRRIVFRQMLPRAEDPDVDRFIRVLGDYLYRDLLTQLGREADSARLQALAQQGETPAVILQAFGLNVAASAREALVEAATRRLAKLLVGRWGQKKVSDLPSLEDDIAGFLSQHKLDPESVWEQLQTACTRALQRNPVEHFDEWLEPCKELPPGKRLPDPAIVRGFLKQVNQLLGTPGGDTLRVPPVPAALRDAAQAVIRKATAQLSSFVLMFLDQPGFRSARAEQAIRQAGGRLEEWLRQYEQHQEQLGQRVGQTMEKLQNYVAESERAGSGGRLSGYRRLIPLADLIEQLSQFPMMRYEEQLSQRVVGVYLSLRGHLTDLMKEIGFCRSRFLEVQNRLVPPPADGDSDSPPVEEGVEQSLLLPRGCQTFDEAVQYLTETLTEEDLLRLDRTVQGALQEKFPLGLAKLCVAPGDRLRDLLPILLESSRAELVHRLPREDVAELFLEDADPQAGSAQLTAMFAKAVPPLIAQGVRFKEELAIVAAADTPAGREFAEIARRHFPQTRAVFNDNADEVVLYREYVGLNLKDLRQVGELGREAYDMTSAVEHFTPHTRLDITAWREIA